MRERFNVVCERLSFHFLQLRDYLRDISSCGSPRAYPFFRKAHPYVHGGRPDDRANTKKKPLVLAKERRPQSKIKGVNFFPPLTDSVRGGLLVDTFSCLARRIRCVRLCSCFADATVRCARLSIFSVDTGAPGLCWRARPRRDPEHTDQEGGKQKAGTTVDGQNYASLTKNTCRRLCVTRRPPPSPDFNVEVRKGRPGGVPRKDKMIAPPDPASLGPFNIEVGGGGGGFSEHNNNTPSFTSTNEFRRVVQGFVHLPTEVLSRTIFPARRAQELLLGPIQRPCLEAVATPRVASRRPSQVLVRCHFGPSALSSPRISSTCPCAALLPPRPSNPRTAQVVRGALQAIDAPRLPPSSESSRPAGIAGRPLCKLNPRVPRNAH